mmetsp:Transcript_6282/g.19408  ORF Transcript_6282/g.19408 Transcript_6282/m.19408 type:complete len:181 (-) Transcript_6282:2606-3148(-)|eukprot:251863-Chlamydomonas_euryale.AAC.14
MQLYFVPSRSMALHAPLQYPITSLCRSVFAESTAERAAERSPSPPPSSPPSPPPLPIQLEQAATAPASCSHQGAGEPQAASASGSFVSVRKPPRAPGSRLALSPSVDGLVHAAAAAADSPPLRPMHQRSASKPSALDALNWIKRDTLMGDFMGGMNKSKSSAALLNLRTSSCTEAGSTSS